MSLYLKQKSFLLIVSYNTKSIAYYPFRAESQLNPYVFNNFYKLIILNNSSSTINIYACLHVFLSVLITPYIYYYYYDYYYLSLIVLIKF